MGVKLLKTKIDLFEGEIFYCGKKSLICDFIKTHAKYLYGSNDQPKLFPIDIIESGTPKFFLYKDNLYMVDKPDSYTNDEMKWMVKEHYYKHNEKFKKLKKEIELYESLDDKIINSSREPIPEKIRFIVWRRDEGKCVQCGSNKGLEFDHIIPFSKGGNNSERNLQLLCEKCNRKKSSKI